MFNTYIVLQLCLLNDTEAFQFLIFIDFKLCDA